MTLFKNTSETNFHTPWFRCHEQSVSSSRKGYVGIGRFFNLLHFMKGHTSTLNDMQNMNNPEGKGATEDRVSYRYAVTTKSQSYMGTV